MGKVRELGVAAVVEQQASAYACCTADVVFSNTLFVYVVRWVQ
jgi:hypothetical protein